MVLSPRPAFGIVVIPVAARLRVDREAHLDAYDARSRRVEIGGRVLRYFFGAADVGRSPAIPAD